MSSKALDSPEGVEEVPRNLPGWTLARDKPRPKKKQGWECPVPSVEDWEEYKQWKKDQGKKDELPAATQIFLADSTLLFHTDPDVQLPWIHRIRCELPRRAGRLSGDLPVKASYIGYGTSDEVAHYEMFKQAMAQIGVVLCRQIHHPPSRFELAHLEQSDLILIGGGDRKRLWQSLGTDLGSSAVAEHVKWRYLQGAVVIAIGEAMSLLGTKSWYSLADGKGVIPFTGWKIFPYIVASEDEGVNLEELVGDLGGAGVVILGIHRGGGMIFNKDGLVEPVKQMMVEYRWDWQSESVKQALLLGPPRGTGLICPLYAARRQRDEEEGGGSDGEVDAYAYALTMEEEQEEESLLEQFDPHNLWLDLDSREEVERLKKQGNDSFKASKADHAGICYSQARTLLWSSAKRWGELGEAQRSALDALAKNDHSKSTASGSAATTKEDCRASNVLVPLLLNICACHLMAHEQDRQRLKLQQANDAKLADENASLTAATSNLDAVMSTTLVEVRDNLVEAFEAANEALLITGRVSAKAFFRRACVFEQLRDPRNALRDLEESLLRAPGDKAITTKRNEIKSAAESVAENMYYARHKELDKQLNFLNLRSRRALFLQGVFGDSYGDNSAQFSMAQPLARLVEGTLEELDGRPRLILPNNDSAESAPYLHTHALWTWEDMIPNAPSLQLLQIHDVDLGSGPLEWLCKGLRLHNEIKTLRLIGCHLGPAGGKMLRNVVAQTRSLIEVALDSCALLDAGLAEVAEGLCDHEGPLEVLSLQRNGITSRKLEKLVVALCRKDTAMGLAELDLSGNHLCFEGAREVARIIASAEHKLQTIVLQDCLLDVAAFWRLVSHLDDARSLSKLDLRCNPIGRGTRRCWRSTMGPSLRCEVLFSDHPLKARGKVLSDKADKDTNSIPLPRHWA